MGTFRRTVDWLLLATLPRGGSAGDGMGSTLAMPEFCRPRIVLPALALALWSVGIVGVAVYLEDASLVAVLAPTFEFLAFPAAALGMWAMCARLAGATGFVEELQLSAHSSAEIARFLAEKPLRMWVGVIVLTVPVEIASLLYSVVWHPSPASQVPTIVAYAVLKLVVLWAGAQGMFLAAALCATIVPDGRLGRRISAAACLFALTLAMPPLVLLSTWAIHVLASIAMTMSNFFFGFAGSNLLMLAAILPPAIGFGLLKRFAARRLLRRTARLLDARIA